MGNLNSSETEIAEYRRIHNIEVKSSTPAPYLDINEASYPAFIQNTFQKLRFTTPTPIQAQAWPIARLGKDMVGIAQTGSGKTLGFLLPMLTHISLQNKNQMPKGLVIAPTRELCNQTFSEAEAFCSEGRLRPVQIFGGASRDYQISELQNQADVIICTPGRALDLIESGELSLADVSFVVLDEADRCLDMGFEPQIREILSVVRPDRQTLMFSATWPQSIRQLAFDFMKNDFEMLVIGSLELAANKSIEQDIIQISNDAERLEIMVDEIHRTPGNALIFCNEKYRVDLLADTLYDRGLKAGAIHGDKKQTAREQVLRRLRENKIKALVATDVAARGLDIKNVTLVINCDCPRDIESYIHRIGRTGRQSADGQQKGRAVTFFDGEEDAPIAKNLMSVLEDAGQRVPSFLRDYRTAGFANKSKRSFAQPKSRRR